MTGTEFNYNLSSVQRRRVNAGAQDIYINIGAASNIGAALQLK